MGSDNYTTGFALRDERERRAKELSVLRKALALACHQEVTEAS